MGCNSAVDDAQRFAHQFWATGEQEPQLKRKTQHPLPDGSILQAFVSQHGSTLSQVSWHRNWDRNPVVRLRAPTVGTAERNQPFMVARTALYAQKSLLQSATFEALIEFLLYAVW